MILVGGAIGVLVVVGVIVMLRGGDDEGGRLPASPTVPAAPRLPAPGEAPAVTQHEPLPEGGGPDAPGAMRFVRGGRTQLGIDAQSQSELVEWCKQMHGADCAPSAFLRDRPLRDTIVKSFYIDRTEVTNRDFAAFLERRHARLQGDRVVLDGKPIARLLPGSGLEAVAGHARARADADDKPVAGVTWTGAQAYCQEGGKRLPLESEWELAARGPYRARFPWGTADPDCERAVFARAAGQACARLGPGPVKVGVTDGDRAFSGVLDLAGNVSEWTLDLYSGKDLPRGPVPWRNVRGGAFDSTVDLLRATRRLPLHEDEMRIDVGFRCAKPAE